MGVGSLLSQKEMLSAIRRLMVELSVSEQELGEPTSLAQSTVSKILTGRRAARYEEMKGFIDVLLYRLSALPRDLKVKDVSIIGEELVSVFSDEPVQDAAERLFEGGFTQLPVMERVTNQCVGLITDGTILERLLLPPKGYGKTWPRELAMRRIIDANIMDMVPIFSVDASLDEAARSLIHHYAILVQDKGTVVGLLTRADFLKFLSKTMK